MVKNNKHTTLDPEVIYGRSETVSHQGAAKRGSRSLDQDSFSLGSRLHLWLIALIRKVLTGPLVHRLGRSMS